MIGGMFFLMLGSSWDDSAIFDEVAHIGAGYTYLRYGDMRLNPEHPPLLKDLAALPLMFLTAIGKINFDTNQLFWTIENVNDRQWIAGNHLLYESENDADQILFWSRLPFMILAVVFGWLIFSWTKNKFGAQVALLTLFFYATSPTFIAHSRFVTTDLGAAFAFFLGIIYFLKFLENPTWKNTVWLGVVLGGALLVKFSLVLLLPVYAILLLLRFVMRPKAQTLQNLAQRDRREQSNSPAGEYASFAKFGAFGKLLASGFVAIIIIWLWYIPHIWNYPQDQHVADVKYILGDYKVKSLAAADVWLVEHKVTRPIGHYLFGFLMVARRTAGGNTAYFKGELSSKGWWSYFPTLALFKEQLAFYIFLLIALFSGVSRIKKSLWGLKNLKYWVSNNFEMATALVFTLIYWASSILNPLNIGVRHVLPTFPFFYLLTAIGLNKWLGNMKENAPAGRLQHLNFVYRTYIKPAPKYFFSSLLMTLMALDILLSFPAYLSYYNVLGGGLRYGYLVATDSNYDWGQDLKRLKSWKEKNGIDKIYLDYFGGGSPAYYLGNKYQGWWSSFGPPPSDSYFAVSLNSLTGNQARPVGDITIKPEDSYPWLRGRVPVARAGSSILIYKIE